MSTPTPRTDAAWASSFEPCEYRAAHTARTMCDECAKLEQELSELRNAERLARVQLGAEREKARVLRSACESICEEWGRNHDANPIGAGQKMETLASKALEKLEDEA